MRTQKIITLAAIPLIVLGLLWVTTQAFHMLSAKSDVMVLGGVALLCAIVFLTLKLLLFIRNKLQ